MMSALVRVVDVDGWKLAVGPDDEPTIEDLELATRLGFSRPRDIRKLIERLRRDLFLKDSDVRATVARGHGFANSRPVTAYRLTESGALKVIAKSETAIADAILDQVIAVFIAYRRGQLVQAPPALPLDVAHGPRIGEVPNLRLDADALCRMTARAAGLSLRRVHGFIRSTYRVGGIYQVSALAWPQVKLTLESLALGKISLPNAKRLPSADRCQLSLLPGGAR